jgi:hypothetical protein
MYAFLQIGHTVYVGIGGIEALESNKSGVILGILKETWMNSLSCSLLNTTGFPYYLLTPQYHMTHTPCPLYFLLM